ncbi:hypothetical protein [Photobacterium damselae]|uniref:hypothetical protein n=1 Tax=Photobacterium damselae TaxID=38293 RepID=UPI00406795BF
MNLTIFYQTNIASAIIDNGGDYLLAVKCDQETLAKAVRQALSEKATIAIVATDVAIEQEHKYLAQQS